MGLNSKKLQKLLGSININFFVVYKFGGAISHSRSTILKNESILCQSAADELRFSVKVCTVCQSAADELHFSVKVSSSWRNGSAIAKLKLGEPKVMPNYGKIPGSCSLNIVLA